MPDVGEVKALSGDDVARVRGATAAVLKRGGVLACSRVWAEMIWDLLATLDAANARADAAERDRDLAIAHDTQPYPTADAYEKACAAAARWKERADAAEERVRELERKHEPPKCWRNETWR
jgi:uncharacterized protein (DUF2237 family)